MKSIWSKIAIALACTAGLSSVASAGQRVNLGGRLYQTAGRYQSVAFLDEYYADSKDPSGTIHGFYWFQDANTIRIDGSIGRAGAYVIFYTNDDWKTLTAYDADENVLLFTQNTTIHSAPLPRPR